MPQPRFKLRTLFYLVLGASICSLAVANMLPEKKPYRVITTNAEWDDLMQQDRAILFINCTWNAYVQINAIYYENLAHWARKNTSADIAFTTIGSDPEPIRSSIIQMWKTNDVKPFSYKIMDGAGCIVWFENGNLVGYELPSAEDNWLELKKKLTQKYFALQ